MLDIIIYIVSLLKTLVLTNTIIMAIRVVYTMDHEIIPRPYKICDWSLNSSWDHFGLHRGKNVKVTMEFESPKGIFEGLHYPLTWSNKFVVGEAKGVL